MVAEGTDFIKLREALCETGGFWRILSRNLRTMDSHITALQYNRLCKALQGVSLFMQRKEEAVTLPN
jgi:hypothetical protein